MTASELKRFRAEKDEVFGRDPGSPLTPEQRRTFGGLAYFDENPQLVINATLDRNVGPDEVRMSTTGGEDQVYHRYGLVRFKVDDQPAQLVLYASDDSDELFIPFRDATSGEESLRIRPILELPRTASGELAQGPDPRRREDVRGRGGA